MKKFLTVLLVIAVMFTFSFGSAFAVTGETYNYAQASALVTKTVNDLCAASEAKMNSAVSNYTEVTVTPTGGNAVGISKEAAKVLFQEQYDAYYNAITAEAKRQQQALADGWNANNNATFTDGSSALDTAAIANAATPPTYEINPADDAAKKTVLAAEFKVAKAAQLKTIEAIDLTSYSEKVEPTSGKTYKKLAQELVSKAISQVNSYVVTDATNATDIADYILYIKGVYTASVGVADATGHLAAGTSVGTYDYAPGLNNLKTESVVLTDEAKIEYAQKGLVAITQQVISGKKAAVIKEKEDIIFQQEVSKTPDQKIINQAKKDIDLATKQYDALLEVWTYRLNNADYKVEKITGNPNEYISAYVNEKSYNSKLQASTQGALAYYAANSLNVVGIYANKNFDEFTAILSLVDAVKIAEHVDELEEQAEILKAGIAVDGDTALAIDDALADAIYDTYMDGDITTVIDVNTVNYEVHDRIHALIGAADKKVTVDGTKYDTVKEWEDAADDGVFDVTNADKVYGIVYDTIDALKEAKTIAEAEKIFLDAYAEYDAVMTDAEHEALFLYGGELYDSYPKAVAEIKAYIDYKWSLMGDTYPATDGQKQATLKAYFEDQLKDDSYSAADLTANLAAAKETVDTLKTKAELTAEEAALYSEVLKVADPVKLADKDAVVDLYRRVMDFNDYADMVGFTTKTAAKEKINKSVLQLAGLEEEAIDAISDEIMKDYKVTLADKENVEKFLDAIDAYNNLYVYDLETVTQWNPTVTYLDEQKDTAKYEKQIFDLEVKEAAKLLSALPSENASAAQLAEARAAVDALGFDGICALRSNPYTGLLTKLNRLEQNAATGTIKAVESLKITASSTAAKGSITVKWRVNGDTSAVEGYEIWKSTKRSSKYSKAFTQKATKQTYKNTKGLKKGTRYYYKVRAIAYTADGTKIKSDWSNKAYRIAK